jgi:translation initiation factor 4G
VALRLPAVYAENKLSQRYDREFLLQFMPICKEEPLIPTSLQFLHINYSEQTFRPIRHGQSTRRSICKMPSLSHGQATATWDGGALGKTNTLNTFFINNFVTHTPRRRFTISNDKWVFSAGTSDPVDMLSGRSLWQSTRVPHDLQRKRSHDSGSPQGQIESKDVALRTVANRWIASSTSAKLEDIDTPEVIDRKVKSLNKLHQANFDSISDQHIAWANKSEKEKDGRTMIQVIRQVIWKEEMWSETYSRLCRKMMEQISPKVQDDSIRNVEGMQ